MKHIILILLMVLLYSCAEIPQGERVSLDPLPSLNEGETKSSIIHFVEEVSNPENENFVPVPDRIAVFDNDGNLWSEKPVYFQLLFAMDRVKELASQYPEWENEQPFKAVLENDMDELHQSGISGLLKIVMATHAGNTTDEFEDIVKKWLSSAKHPRVNRPYTDLVYQPMLKLMRYLEQNDFKVFIVSGGGIEFITFYVISSSYRFFKGMGI